jgi:uncharacterized membrane protein YeaQ/YmgE (transglycosylase-associated protein family)
MGTVFHVIGWALFGLIVGTVARFLVPGNQPMSLLVTALLGIFGSFLGGGFAWLIWGTRREPMILAGGSCPSSGPSSWC